MNQQNNRPRRPKKGSYQTARMELPERNLLVEAPTNIISWLQMGLIDPAFEASVARGEVRVGPLNGQGPSVTYPHAVPALRVLRTQINYPSVSVFFIDKKTERLIWKFGRDTVFIPLTESLTDHRFVDLQLHRILIANGATPEQRARVFPEYAPRSAKVEKEAKVEEPSEPAEEKETEVSDIPLSELDLETRTLNAFNEAGFATSNDVLALVRREGAKKLLEVDGIGEKSLKNFWEALQKRGVEVPQTVDD